MLGIIIVVIISIFREKFASNGIIEMSNLNIFEYIYLFFTGIIAISAMVLPGISGSTLLLIFGVYIPIISSINKLLSSDFTVIGGLLVFALGICFGLIFSVRLIRRAFLKHRSKMIYFIIGLTLGSIYAIMLGPTTLEKKQTMINYSNFSILGFIIGVMILVLLGVISQRNKGEKLEKSNKY